MSVRRAAVLLHRYVGLGLAAFLVLVGLTGAAIAWNDELERVFAPSMFVLPTVDEARPPLDAFALRDAAEQAAPGFAINGVGFIRERDEPARFYIEALPGGPAPLNDEIALDPATGLVIGMRQHGDLRQGMINLMPFIYDLHDSLALGDTGSFILGVVALLWTADCFIGAYLTFPARWTFPHRLTLWAKRWSRAWKLRWPATPFKLTFDLHSVGGLWLWGCF